MSLGERYDRGVYVPDLGVGVGSHQLERPRYVGKLNLQKSVSPAYDVLEKSLRDRRAKTGRYHVVNFAKHRTWHEQFFLREQGTGRAVPLAVYVEQGEQAARVGKDAQRFCRAS